MAVKILVIEDEQAVREMLFYALNKADFEVREAANGEIALDILKKYNIDLILLDWMLPGQAGIEISKKLRSMPETKNIPIIMLTAKSEESDKIMGLDSGADDYVTKPFSPNELIARIKAILRRASPQTSTDTVSIGSITLNPSTHKVIDGDNELDLGPTEFKLLHFFMTHPDRVYSRSQLLDFVWGRNVYVEERTVDVHILRLRKSLKPDSSKHIQTVRGAGYRFSN